jgi:hypothetical protein
MRNLAAAVAELKGRLQQFEQSMPRVTSRAAARALTFP